MKVMSKLDKFVAAVRELHSPSMDPACIPATFNRISADQRPAALAHIKALHMNVVESVASRVVGVARYKMHSVGPTVFRTWGDSIDPIVPNTLVNVVVSSTGVDDLLFVFEVIGLSYQLFVAGSREVPAAKDTIFPNRVEYAMLNSKCEDDTSVVVFGSKRVGGGEDFDYTIDFEDDNFDFEECVLTLRGSNQIDMAKMSGTSVHVLYADAPTTHFFCADVCSKHGLPDVTDRADDLTTDFILICVNAITTLFDTTGSVPATMRELDQIAAAGRKQETSRTMERLAAQLREISDQ